MVKNQGTLLNITKALTEDKLLHLKDIFDFDDQELRRVVKICPSFIIYSINAIDKKKELLDSLNITKEDILKNPIILATASNSIKLKYMMLYLADPKKNFMRQKWSMQNQKKTWARIMELKSLDIPLTPSLLFSAEKNFQKRFKVSGEELMKKYPLTEEVVRNIIVSYNKHARKTKEPEIEITDDEISAML